MFEDALWASFDKVNAIADEAVRYRFTDICGEIFPDPASEDFGTQVVVQFNEGSGVNPETGVITFNVEYVGTSCCGLLGQKVLFTATPK